MRLERSAGGTLEPPQLDAEATTVTAETILVNMVEEWAVREVPRDPDVAAKAAALALQCYVGGASVSEACEEARRFVRCWMRHPSRTRSAKTSLSIAS